MNSASLPLEFHEFSQARHYPLLQKAIVDQGHAGWEDAMQGYLSVAWVTNMATKRRLEETQIRKKMDEGGNAHSIWLWMGELLNYIGGSWFCSNGSYLIQYLLQHVLLQSFQFWKHWLILATWYRMTTITRRKKDESKLTELHPTLQPHTLQYFYSFVRSLPHDIDDGIESARYTKDL